MDVISLNHLATPLPSFADFAYFVFLFGWLHRFLEEKLVCFRVGFYGFSFVCGFSGGVSYSGRHVVA